MMGNGMFCEAEIHYEEPNEEEKLKRDSRKTLNYLKSSHNRMLLLMRKLEIYKSNPLGFAMCKDLEIKIYQLSLLLQRHHQQLVDMDEKYKRMHQAEPEPLTKNSSLADWQEVINMAKLPIDPLFIYSQSNKTKSCEPVFKSIYHSPSSETTANALSTDKLDEQNTSGIQVKRVSQATFPMQMTPPMEEIVQLREKVRALEKSPLFASTTTDNIKSKCSLAVMPVHRSPISQR